MAGAAWSCTTCGAPGVKNLGAHGHCSTHVSELLVSFDASAFDGLGLGLQDGRLRADHGPGYADCRCIVCDATSVQRAGSPCAYCEWRTVREASWVEFDDRRAALEARTMPTVLCCDACGRLYERGGDGGDGAIAMPLAVCGLLGPDEACNGRLREVRV